MHIAGPDRTLGAEEWCPFVAAEGFGHFIAPGRDREFPVVVPTQFVLDGNEVVLHLAGPNPVFDALRERQRAMLSVAGDWAFVPSDWKAIDDEDPSLGIPTTYYAAVKLFGSVRVDTDPAAVAAVLRRQLCDLQPETPVADPEVAHAAKLRLIRGITLSIDDVRAKFKYGGNVDDSHRKAVVERLRQRRGPGDLAAAGHVESRSG
ncbi:MAG: FMN-binding negative transcriptional regulator [Acidimicrobiales bacterium]